MSKPSATVLALASAIALAPCARCFANDAPPMPPEAAQTIASATLDPVAPIVATPSAPAPLAVCASSCASAAGASSASTWVVVGVVALVVVIAASSGGGSGGGY